MTERERILTTIRGESPDRLPWVPRLEFWHRARVRNGTLPAELRALSLMEIADRLDVGYYSVIPDFTECPGKLDMIDYPLGIFRFPKLLFETTLEGVDRRILRRGRETVSEYHTPVGSIRTATVFTDEMLDAGASVPWITEHAIREPGDFEVAGYIFSHLRVEPRLERYAQQRDAMGDRGIVVGYVSGSACPIHHIMRELMTVEQFFYAMHDCPERIHALAERMEPFCDRIRNIVADSEAEVILLGGNYDDSITYPPFFQKHIQPALRDYAETLHRRGKYLLTHTDGENRKLMPLYLDTGFDVADSVCPHPMTHLRLEEILGAFAGRITVWGGIPSVLLCPDSVSEDEFRRSIDDLVERYAQWPRFILGVSDMVTADADWNRLMYVTERLRRIGSGS